MNDPTLLHDLRELLAVVERTADLRPVRQRATMLRYRLAALVPDENDRGGE